MSGPGRRHTERRPSSHSAIDPPHQTSYSTAAVIFAVPPTSLRATHPRDKHVHCVQRDAKLPNLQSEVFSHQRSLDIHVNHTVPSATATTSAVTSAQYSLLLRLVVPLRLVVLLLLLLLMPGRMHVAPFLHSPHETCDARGVGRCWRRPAPHVFRDGGELSVEITWRFCDGTAATLALSSDVTRKQARERTCTAKPTEIHHTSCM